MGKIISNFSLFLSLGFLLSACQASHEKPLLETTAELEFVVASYVNPDADNRTSPLNITLLRLRDDRQFEQEDFIDVYLDPAKHLSGDLIGKQSLQELLPGESRVEHLELAEDVRYLGVVAAFSDYKHAESKLVLTVEPNQTNHYKITIEGRSMSAIKN
ncbi:type VI secretion system lipoprotein TssJ [Marinobacter sp. chi1]|uniref:Type VI secretion system lipoprotein TssJ n=1 Tax=Marinobacter suaedae TaxID=3057675 RepID=A0ABT8VW09_9GAMM|nr:type VI secretion system lipoprotein TssJ [Marinobacter sp. chi1]MDO3720171.1 type VI secretion system lipoprotein TssJ [Marinobacter sp. chi1]